MMNVEGSTGCCPGDDLTTIITSRPEIIEVILGKGLILNSNNEIRATLGGSLYSKQNSSYWIESNKRFYEPVINDQIIGIIEERAGDYYKVNISSSSIALLNRLSFEGATKRNRPELKHGDVIYTRVLSCHKHLDTELTCIASSSSRRDWSSGECIYGQLTEGLIIKVSQIFAQSLLMPKNSLLNCLGKQLSFEIAIGVNGIIWIKGNNCQESVLIRNAIIRAETLDETTMSVEQFVINLLQGLKRKT